MAKTLEELNTIHTLLRTIQSSRCTYIGLQTKPFKPGSGSMYRYKSDPQGSQCLKSWRCNQELRHDDVVTEAIFMNVNTINLLENLKCLHKPFSYYS